MAPRFALDVRNQVEGAYVPCVFHGCSPVYTPEQGMNKAVVKQVKRKVGEMAQPHKERVPVRLTPVAVAGNVLEKEVRLEVTNNGLAVARMQAQLPKQCIFNALAHTLVVFAGTYLITGV